MNEKEFRLWAQRDQGLGDLTLLDLVLRWLDKENKLQEFVDYRTQKEAKAEKEASKPLTNFEIQQKQQLNAITGKPMNFNKVCRRHDPKTGRSRK